MPLSIEILNNYVKDFKVFVETGTLDGTGVKLAKSVGFEHIQSIELDEKCYNFATCVFKDNKNIKIYQGDSASVLNNVLESIKDNTVFWLDAHPLGYLTINNTPIKGELKAIKDWMVTTGLKPIILIDDMRLFENKQELMGLIVSTFHEFWNKIECTMTNENVINKPSCVLEVKIKFLDSHVASKDIMEVRF